MNLDFFSAVIPGILVGVLLTACGSTAKQPQWLDKPSTDYPQTRYLSATAQANKRDTAGDRALANLAKIFEVAVKEQSIDFSSSEAIGSQDQVETRNEQRVARHVSTAAREVLEGAKIVEFWQSDEEQVYALAVLNKSEAARRFKQDITSADRKVRQLVNYASNDAPNAITALTALNSARAVQSARDNLRRNLSIVSGTTSASKYSVDQLEELIRQALATLQFSVRADDEVLLTELQNAVGSLGIQYNPQSSMALSGVIDTEPVEQKQSWYWLRGSYELSLLTGDTVIAKKRWPIKVSATDKGMVQQRARDTINSHLPNYVFELLTSAKTN